MLDTNVLLSAALFPSAAMTAFIEQITINNSIVLCSYVLDELSDVVLRKFPAKQREVEVFFQKFPYALIHTPKIDILGLGVAIRDEADYPVLMSAVLADVDVLITGDKDFFGVAIEKPEILMPAEFMVRYG